MKNILSITGVILSTVLVANAQPLEEETTPSIASGVNNAACQCGVSNNKRIFGGEIAQENEFPWQIFLHLVGNKDYNCSGSIISEKTIITAVHCTLNRSIEDIRVIVGLHDLRNLEAGEEVRLCGKLEHPHYLNTQDPNFAMLSDYTLLTLCEPLQFSRTVSPICLPRNQDELYEDDSVMASGWGKNADNLTILKKTKLRTMTNDECIAKSPGVTIDGSVLCVLTTCGTTCIGDSGGPLMAEDPTNGYKVLIGSTSFGDTNCTHPESPPAFARVSFALPWITANMQGATCSPPGEDSVLC